MHFKYCEEVRRSQRTFWCNLLVAHKRMSPWRASATNSVCNYLGLLCVGEAVINPYVNVNRYRYNYGVMQLMGVNGLNL
jgi:hypothetical protein